MGRHWVDRVVFCFFRWRRAIAGGLKITALVIPFSAHKKKTICAFPPKIALVGGRCLEKKHADGGEQARPRFTVYIYKKRCYVSHRRVDAPDGDLGTAIRSYRSLGDLPDPPDGNVSKRLVCLQHGMCLRVFFFFFFSPSYVNTVLAREGEKKKCSNFSGEGCTLKCDWPLLCSDCEEGRRESEWGKQLYRIKTGTRAAGFFRLN